MFEQTTFYGNKIDPRSLQPDLILSVEDCTSCLSTWWFDWQLIAKFLSTRPDYTWPCILFYIQSAYFKVWVWVGVLTRAGRRECGRLGTQLSCSSAEEPVWQLGLQVHTTTSQQAAHCHCPARPLSKFLQHTGSIYLIRFCLHTSAAPFRDILQFKTRLEKVLSPLSLQRRSHLVNVHRTRTSLAEKPQFCHFHFGIALFW